MISYTRVFSLFEELRRKAAVESYEQLRCNSVVAVMRRTSLGTSSDSNRNAIRYLRWVARVQA